MRVKIFVEGIADKKFLEDYLSEIYKINVSNEMIDEVGGWTNIYSKNESEVIVNKMILNTDDGGVNLLIFDADSNFAVRSQEIKDWKKDKNLNFETFLWPNNLDSGDLETVLENIINSNNSSILDCWDDYENCLKSKTIQGRGKPLTIPARKTKIYGYLEVLLGTSKSQKEKIKERNRNYKNKEVWDLKSAYLKELREFLDKAYK